MEQAAEARARGDDLERERAAGRPHPAAPHVLRERGHRQLLRDLRLADERARAAPAHEKALADEVVQRRAHREPRDAEIGAQLALRRDRLADVEAARSGRAPGPWSGSAWSGCSRRQPAVGASAGCGSSTGSPTRLRPVSGSKKWKRAGSTARRRRSPTRAVALGLDARGEERALALERLDLARCGLRVAGRRGVDGEEDVRVGAELLEHRHGRLQRRQPGAREARPRSNASGRIPRTIRPVAGGRAPRRVERHADASRRRPRRHPAAPRRGSSRACR